MKLIITGAGGQLGRELVHLAENSGMQPIGLAHADLDIAKARDVAAAISSYKPGIVVNTAAYTNVDKAESEPNLAYAINRDGAGNIAIACQNSGIPVIHISTDFVFNGQKKGAYSEEDEPDPINVYGLSKLAGEKLVREACRKHIILRTSWLFSAYGNNFVKTILRLAAQKRELRVVADQYGCPTSAGDLAKDILTIIPELDNACWGAYHYCGQPSTSWHGFAEAIVEEMRLHQMVKNTSIKPITTSDYPSAAKRPPNSTLDCSAIRRNFRIPKPAWKNSLREVIKTLLSELC